MEEAAEAQEKICDIHYKQMEKADRDPMHALRAEDECRQLMVQFPNSKFAPQAQQMLRNIQEVLADKRIPRRHASIRTRAASRPRPTACRAWPTSSRCTARPTKRSGSSPSRYHRMGDRFENQQADGVPAHREGLPAERRTPKRRKRSSKSMKRPVPEADPVAYGAHEVRDGEPHQARDPEQGLGPVQRSHPDMTPGGEIRHSADGQASVRRFRRACLPRPRLRARWAPTKSASRNPGSDSEIDKGKEVRANPNGEAPAAAPGRRLLPRDNGTEAGRPAIRRQAGAR